MPLAIFSNVNRASPVGILVPVALWNEPLWATGRLVVYEFPLELIPTVPSVDKPLEFGEVTIYGKVRLFKKENIKSQPVYIYAEEATKLEGSFLGKYELKKNNFYRCSIDTLGRNPRLQRNNIWLSRNNLEYLGLPTISESLEIIQKNI